MIRIWLALAVLCAGTAWGAGPSYSVDSIRNASDGALGPFAPNSVLSIYGANLARSPHALGVDDLVPCPDQQAGRCLPDEMNYVRVFVQGRPVRLLFVSEWQINFLMSPGEPAGPVTVRVATQGNSGPEVTVTLVDAAPALFSMAGGYAIATDAKGKLLTVEAPAHAGDIVVVYATGLGQTSPGLVPGQLPIYAATMVTFASLKVTLNGKAVAPWDIKYAGVTPGSAGLYQINLYLPEGTGNDPEIQVTAGNQAAQTGLKLPLR